MKYLKVILGAAFVVAIAGAYFFPQAVVPFGSAVGTTFNSAKFAGIVTVPLTASATSTSVQNTDAGNRYVTGTNVGCTGVGTSGAANGASGGLATLTLQIGTTTASAPAAFSSFAQVASLTISTSSQNILIASTTPITATSSLAAIWPSGSYMTFYWNATNTAACTVGVSYMGS